MNSHRVGAGALLAGKINAVITSPSRGNHIEKPLINSIKMTNKAGRGILAPVEQLK